MVVSLSLEKPSPKFSLQSTSQSPLSIHCQCPKTTNLLIIPQIRLSLLTSFFLTPFFYQWDTSRVPQSRNIPSTSMGPMSTRPWGQWVTSLWIHCGSLRALNTLKVCDLYISQWRDLWTPRRSHNIPSPSMGPRGHVSLDALREPQGSEHPQGVRLVHQSVEAPVDPS